MLGQPASALNIPAEQLWHADALSYAANVPAAQAVQLTPPKPAVPARQTVGGGGEDMTGFGEDMTDVGEDTIGAGEDTIGAGEDTIGTGEDTIGAGEDTIGAGEDTIGAGEDTIGTGEDTIGAGEDTIGTGEDTIGAGEDTIGAGVVGVGVVMDVKFTHALASISTEIFPIGQFKHTPYPGFCLYLPALQLKQNVEALPRYSLLLTSIWVL
jgi:hypothetical protein